MECIVSSLLNEILTEVCKVTDGKNTVSNTVSIAAERRGSLNLEPLKIMTWSKTTAGPFIRPGLIMRNSRLNQENRKQSSACKEVQTQSGSSKYLKQKSKTENDKCVPNAVTQYTLIHAVLNELNSKSDF